MAYGLCKKADEDKCIIYRDADAGFRSGFCAIDYGRQCPNWSEEVTTARVVSGRLLFFGTNDDVSEEPALMVGSASRRPFSNTLGSLAVRDNLMGAFDLSEGDVPYLPLGKPELNEDTSSDL